MIRIAGSLTHRSTQARSLTEAIQNRFDTLHPLSVPLTTTYLIWRNPYMAAGGDTFIHDMLQRCGLTNLLSTTNRYPTVDTETLSRCDRILLSSEPYPFREKHIDELRKLLPSHPGSSTPVIQLVDGQIFSWYGSRLLEAPAWLQSFIKKIPIL